MIIIKWLYLQVAACSLCFSLPSPWSCCNSPYSHSVCLSPVWHSLGNHWQFSTARRQFICTIIIDHMQFCCWYSSWENSPAVIIGYVIIVSVISRYWPTSIWLHIKIVSVASTWYIKLVARKILDYKFYIIICCVVFYMRYNFISANY